MSCPTYYLFIIANYLYGFALSCSSLWSKGQKRGGEAPLHLKCACEKHQISYREHQVTTHAPPCHLLPETKPPSVLQKDIQWRLSKVGVVRVTHILWHVAAAAQTSVGDKHSLNSRRALRRLRQLRLLCLCQYL